VADSTVLPSLRCAIVLGSAEEECQVFAGGEAVSVRYAPQVPRPRTERVLPGHLVAMAAVPETPAVVVWRWYDAVVLESSPQSVRLWEPAHGEVTARRRRPEQGYEPGSRAYLSAGLPGADWWVAGPAAGRAEDAEVELAEVDRLYREHDLWESALSLRLQD
jgi:hypothetical protein